MTSQPRNRIVEHIVVKGSDLKVNPDNWRRHSDEQKEILRTIIDRFGWVSELLAFRDESGELMLFDGEARSNIYPDQEIPVTVIDLEPDERRALLALYDPIGSMIEVNQQRLRDLMPTVEGLQSGIQKLLNDLVLKGLQSEQTGFLSDLTQSGNDGDWNDGDDRQNSSGPNSRVFPTRTLTYAATEKQAADIESAIKRAREFYNYRTGVEALAHICLNFLEMNESEL